jgi:hypothetical protein
LTKVADIAAVHGLGIDMTFFTGHMSGPNWSPRWLLGGDIKPRTWCCRRRIAIRIRV